MYDSRRIYDSEGSPLAHFRSTFKSTLTGGFGIIDMRGLEDEHASLDRQPWLGQLERSDGTFGLRLVGDYEAGKIQRKKSPSRLPHSDTQPARSIVQFEIHVGQRVQANRLGTILLLASALALAWHPEPD
jgi:hypothetical protein